MATTLITEKMRNPQDNSWIPLRAVASDSDGLRALYLNAQTGKPIELNEQIATFRQGAIESLSEVTNLSLKTPTIQGGTLSGTISASGGTISGGTISGGTISGGTISGGTISGGTISGTISASGATVSGGTFSGGSISNATISGGSISNTKLSDVTIENPNFGNLNFNGKPITINNGVITTATDTCVYTGATVPENTSSAQIWIQPA